MKHTLPISLANAPAPRQGGFTMIEVVIVIMVTAIIGAAVAIFIRMPVRSYVDSAARADLVDTGDTALRRMSRDLRLALPNSVRVTTDGSGDSYIELLLTRTGGRYLSTDDNPVAGVGNVLDFYNASTTNTLKFDIVGPIPGQGTILSPEQTIQAGSDSVVVYNLGPGIIPADAYQTTAGSMNRALISGISGPTITMASNPFDQQTIKMMSPQHRFQVISGPVTYLCNPTAGTLTRYWNYTIATAQPTSVAGLTTGSGAQSALMAKGVSSCKFYYSTSTSMSNALAVLDIQLMSNDSGNSTVGLFEQVHIDNTP